MRRPERSVECSDSEKKMSACADQNHAPSLTCVRLEFHTLEKLTISVSFCKNNKYNGIGQKIICMFIFEAVKNYYYGNVNKKIPVFFLEKRLLANKTKYRDFRFIT